ncbi:MAG: type 2 isopentenyl-diphosphate Delta-isomerase [Candidatus Bathyarchaeota archaeon]|nr:type 2 isopentenyl-diphosphate Delta-isomerase [Candidatus Bathyarchaeota archaeon]
MAEETIKRKNEHIQICLEEKVEAKNVTAGFEDLSFVHRALPEIDREKIDLSTTFLDHRFAAPLLVGAITGGTEKAEKINTIIAQAVQTLGLGMGVGSQRAAIEDPKVAQTFVAARKKAPNAFLIANIGGVQLVYGYGVEKIKKAIEMIDANAVAIHLNALQETVQPHGDTNFEGVLAGIGKLADALDKPVIVKETGCGICGEDAKRLEEAGVAAIDVGGVGGTSFAAVEYYRAKKEGNKTQQKLGEAFWDWGIPTVASVAEVSQSVKIHVVASGGLRSGLDAAKTLALNASMASICLPVLHVAEKGVEETQNALKQITEEIKNTMFLVGAKDLSDLAHVPIVVTGKTKQWLNTRGFNTDIYAKRRE